VWCAFSFMSMFVCFYRSMGVVFLLCRLWCVVFFFFSVLDFVLWMFFFLCFFDRRCRDDGCECCYCRCYFFDVFWVFVFLCLLLGGFLFLPVVCVSPDACPVQFHRIWVHFVCFLLGRWVCSSSRRALPILKDCYFCWRL